ncbi:conserved hypothetical protein [Thiomonas sp. X19]|nr:conserved hypothetical protein [Thiomonas sp. X19]
MPSQCLANHRERSISAPLSKKTRRTDQSDSLGFKSDSLLGCKLLHPCRHIPLANPPSSPCWRSP